MPRNQWLTRQLKQKTAQDDPSQELIRQLAPKLQTFHENSRSVLPKEEELFQLWLDLLKETANHLAGLSTSWRSTRLQARTHLCDIFSEIGPEVFLLCTLTISISTLAGRNLAARKNCVPVIKEWWTTVTVPKRLTELASELCKAHSIGAAVAEYLQALKGEGSSSREDVPAPNNVLPHPTQQQHDATQDVRYTASTQVPQVEATNENLGGEESGRQPSQTSSSNAASESGDLHPSSVITYAPYRTNLQDGDLLSFLEAHPGEYPTLAIRIPAGEHESPSIEISRAMCQELIGHVMESTRQRMSEVPGIGGHLDMAMTGFEPAIGMATAI